MSEWITGAIFVLSSIIVIITSTNLILNIMILTSSLSSHQIIVFADCFLFVVIRLGWFCGLKV
jgi:hypothetical protein